MPTVILSLNGSPVRPSYNLTLPFSGKPAFKSSALMSSSEAPSSAGVIALTAPTLAVILPRILTLPGVPVRLLLLSDYVRCGLSLASMDRLALCGQEEHAGAWL